VEAFAIDLSFENREQECARFTGAGLGDANDVATFANGRYGLDLDRRGCLPPTFFNGAQQGLRSYQV
jgi:hypothetical protein